MRLAFLTSRTVPHDEADVEQLVQTSAACAAVAGVAVAVLAVPPPGTDAGPWPHMVARHYGLPACSVAYVPLRSRLLVPAGVRAVSGGRVSGPQAVADAEVFTAVRRQLARTGPDAVVTRRWMLGVAAARAGWPTFYETHSPSHAGTLGLLARRLGWRGIIVHSEHARRAFLAKGLPPALVRVVRNGHDPARLLPVLTRADARRRLALDPLQPVACYAGRLNARKDPGALLEVARRTPQVRWLLVGALGAPERTALEHRARQVGADNVTVLDRVAPADLAPYLYAADVLVIPPTAAPVASGRTVLPLKTFLYMAAGRPILAPATPDLAELLEHGRNAWLVPPGDVEAAAQAVICLTTDSGKAATLARVATADAAACTWDRRAERLLVFIGDRLRP